MDYSMGEEGLAILGCCRAHIAILGGSSCHFDLLRINAMNGHVLIGEARDDITLHEHVPVQKRKTCLFIVVPGCSHWNVKDFRVMFLRVFARWKVSGS